MKSRTALLTLSLAANALLLAALAWRPSAVTAFYRELTAPRPVINPASAAPTAPAAAEGKSAALPTPGATALAWTDVAPGDFAGLVARLRAAGFPPSIVRTVAMAAVNEHFAGRRFALLGDRISADYWRNPRDDFARNARTQTALRELGREQSKLLREVLGDDFERGSPGDEWAELSRRRQFGDMPAATIDQIQRIDRDYNELTAKIHEDSLGIMLPEDRAKLALLEKEKRADLERLLSSEELLDYDLRNSPSAHAIRNRLGRFEPTEAEFRALFAAQQEFDARNPRTNPPDAALARQRNEATEAAFRSVLGEARFAEFKQATTEVARIGANEDQVARLVTRLELPPATTSAVMSIQQDITQRFAAVRNDRALAPEQRAAQTAALAAEASTRLGSALGDRGFEVYKQNGGQWLQSLARPPMPAPRPGG